MKTLVVDDCMVTLRIERRQLEKLGLTDIHEAGNGFQALERLKQGGFELIVMDWDMPVMSGIEALKIIKADPATSGITVIMVSARLDKVRCREALEAGAGGCASKPLDLRTFRQKIFGAHRSAKGGKNAAC